MTQLSSPSDCIAETYAEGCGTTNGLGLKGADWVATSPDGKNVYVASFFGNSVAAFTRNDDGSLTEIGCVSQSASSECPASSLGLSDPGSVTVSPDGKNVYVTGESYQTVMVFTRNTDGSLTSDGCVQDVTAVVTPSICGTTAHGLINPYDIAVSADGANLYVAAGGSGSLRGAIVEFARADDGALTQLAAPNDCIEEQGDATPVCGTSDATGLLATTALAVTPDGDNLYAVSDTHLVRTGDAPGAIAEFGRDPGTGALAQLAGPDACVGESGATGASECTSTTATGLGDLVNLAVSPDGANVYTASDDPTGPIAEFSRGTGGALAALGCISSGATCGASAAGLAASFGIAASPDGDDLYVAAAGDGSSSAPGLVSLVRAPNGTLAAADCTQQEGNSGATCAATDGHGLADALGVAVTPDGANVYVASSSSGASGFGGAVAAFARDTGPGTAPTPAPVVSGVTPDEGSSDGGDNVTITGTGFTEATTVDFTNGRDEAQAASFTVDSDSTITAVTPDFDGSDATVDVLVTTPNGTSAATQADQYTFGAATTTTLSAPRWAIYPGEAAAVTATVSPAPDGGTVTFTDGSGTIDGCDAVPLSDGSATCTVSYAHASHQTITATYAGSGDSLSSSAEQEVAVDQQPTTAALTVSETPTAGQPVTYTLAVSPQPDGGTVAFSDGGDPLAGCAAKPVTAGVASCVHTYSTVGSHDIQALYSGNADDSPASDATTVDIGKPLSRMATSLAVSATPASPTSGALVEYTATVTPVPDSGTIGFTDGTSAVSGCGVAPVDANGVATCLTAAGQAGPHTVTANYTGDTLFDAASKTISVTVTASGGGGGGGGPTAVVTTLGVSPATGRPGQPVTYTATMAPSPDGGTVTFTDAGFPIGACATVAVAGGTAQCVTTYSSNGTHAVTASYSGDAGFAPSTSSPLTLAVKTSTTTTFAANTPAVVGAGDATSYVVTVSPVPDGGTVAFADGAAVLSGCGSIPVDTTTGTASCTATLTTIGAHSLIATYSGSANFSGSSTSLPVQAKAATTTVFTTAPAIAAKGVATTYTVTVSPPSAAGAVTFSDGAAAVAGCDELPIGTSTGTASCTVTFAATGAHTLLASYTGSADHAGSSAQTHVDVKLATTIAFTTSPAAVATGDTFTYQANVTPFTYGGPGTVTFTDDGLAVHGCGSLLAGPQFDSYGVVHNAPVDCTISFDSAGSHMISAVFSGTANYAGSSTSTTVTVGTPPMPPDVTLDVDAGSFGWGDGYDWSDTCEVGGAGVGVIVTTCSGTTSYAFADMTFSASVSPPPTDPSATVSIDVTASDGSTSTCSGTVVAGKATCTISTRSTDSVSHASATVHLTSPDGYALTTTSPPVDFKVPFPTTGTVEFGGWSLDGYRDDDDTYHPANHATVGQPSTLVGDVSAVTSQTHSCVSGGNCSTTTDSSNVPDGVGTWTFTDNGNPIPACTAIAASTCTVTFATSGVHAIGLTYTQDALDTYASASWAGTIMVDPPPPPPPAPLTPPTPPKGVSTYQGAVSTDPNGTATATIGDVTATGDGVGAFTLADYPSQPTGTIRILGQYLDLQTAKGSTFNQISVSDCNMSRGEHAYFWIDGAWLAASQETYDALSGCTTILINATTTPSLRQLTGTIMGIGRLASAYVATGPTRVLDTRSGLGASKAQVGPKSAITLTVPNLPAGTTAVVLNLAATHLTGAVNSFVSACPAAQGLADCTKTSALNVVAGRDIANELTVPVGPDGKITLYNNAGHIDLIADLAGYQTGGFTAAGPTRVLDTRSGLGASKAQVGPKSAITLTVPNLPAGTTAVVLNLAATHLTGAVNSFVSACPAAQGLADCTKTSALNVVAGRDIANELTVPVGPDGKITLYNNAGHTDLVADLAGYDVPGAPA